MADIFISYASEDRPFAQLLGTALETHGWSVWWDTRLLAGKIWDIEIEKELHAARCVVVLWSSASRESHWVKEEATHGLERGVLVPACIDDVGPPFGFRHVQAENLDGWTGDRTHAGLARLMDAVRACLDAYKQSAAPDSDASLAPDTADHPHPPADAGPSLSREQERGSDGAGSLYRDQESGSDDDAGSLSRAGEEPGRQWRHVSPRRGGVRVDKPVEPSEPDESIEAGDRAGKPKNPILKYGLVAAVAAAGIAALVFFVDRQSPSELPKPPPAVAEKPPQPVDEPAVAPETDQTAVSERAGGKRSPLDFEAFRDCEVCPEMVALPGGTFTIGSPPNEKGRRESEGPQREVTIEPFAIGKYEVTFAEWDACVEAGGCNGHRPNDAGWGRGRRPVIVVSWDDAQAYVAWLSKKTGQSYRLPSEAEWEFAARAGTTTRFAFGDEITSKDANFHRWVGKTTEVGSYSPNAWDLHDMHGNVGEWVEDHWHGSYDGAPTDGSAWMDNQGKKFLAYRVIRGGSWGGSPRLLRSAYRHRYGPDFRSHFLGFRVARTLN